MPSHDQLAIGIMRCEPDRAAADHTIALPPKIRLAVAGFGKSLTTTVWLEKSCMHAGQFAGDIDNRADHRRKYDAAQNVRPAIRS